MKLARRHAAPGRRWLIRAGLGAAVAGGVTLAVLAGTTLMVARRVVTPPRRATQDMRIVSVDRENGRITLTAHPESRVDGRYGLWFDRDSGYAKIGTIVRQDVGSVTRELVALEEGNPRPGARCRISGWYYRDPSELGFEYEEVVVPTTVGPAPAWRIDPPDPTDRWVVQVHGRAVDRREGIRAIPVFRGAGFTSLLISYRNDGVAPRSEDGLYALGDVEWLDVEAALRYALDHGAKDVVLMGWSMGGATVLQTVSRSKLAHVVRGVVLESPVVDWVTALDHQAGMLRIPRLVTTSVYRILSRPWGRLLTGQSEPIDLRRLDFVTRAMELRVPMLILHNSGDRFVPNAASRALAEARPDIVDFPEIEGAGHTRVWNSDPERWVGMITAWLESRVRRRSAP
ncbi:alpha/beta fold hydrolase [Salinibacterium sp. SYSU T00001]|uniref:alpha/beta hydrolase family protein n=1 Tax=Homoserinimonas sedimenticola TaxID=2986805 RepID=UPI002235A78D|nr:alpha/beta fold hydrolase [Salinibacterium sedimenticola]MCW4384304.1 alpha/beta fold hydrolase [Salinibacterium sedimenticola]